MVRCSVVMSRCSMVRCSVVMVRCCIVMVRSCAVMFRYVAVMFSCCAVMFRCSGLISRLFLCVSRQVGSRWKDVVAKCIKGHFQPLLLFYSNPDGSAIVSDDPAQQRPTSAWSHHKNPTNGDATGELTQHR